MTDYEQVIIDYLTTHLFMAVLVCVLSVALVVLAIIAMWKIFVKAGEKGWKAIIPIYDVYILFKIAWKTKMFWIFLVLTILCSIFDATATYYTVKDSTEYTALMAISAVFAIITLVITIMLYFNLSKAFGHGAGFTVGLVFLSTIFTLILGFGSSQYVGNPTEGPKQAIQKSDNKNE